MHIGSLSTALASFLEARARGGSWLVRIEDIDPYRTVPGASDGILKTLEKFGLEWDDEVVYQSCRQELYRFALEQLDDSGLIYACCCSRKTLERHRRDSTAAVYPGWCRTRRVGRNRPHALRVRTDPAIIAFDDRLQGLYQQSLKRDIGDFVVRRRDLAYAYQLAVVVDDDDQGITEVVRGFDLLESTPRQIFLQRSLGLPTPAYSHLPVIVDETGKKLSKQTSARAVDGGHPSGTLFYLLQKLGQPPPASLAGAPPRELLSWAVEHWNPAPLRGLRHLPL